MFFPNAIVILEKWERVKMFNNRRLMKINDLTYPPKMIIERPINDTGKCWKYNSKWEKGYKVILMEIISIC